MAVCTPIRGFCFFEMKSGGEIHLGSQSRGSDLDAQVSSRLECSDCGTTRSVNHCLSSQTVYYHLRLQIQPTRPHHAGPDMSQAAQLHATSFCRPSYGTTKDCERTAFTNVIVSLSFDALLTFAVSVSAALLASIDEGTS